MVALTWLVMGSTMNTWQELDPASASRSAADPGAAPVTRPKNLRSSAQTPQNLHRSTR